MTDNDIIKLYTNNTLTKTIMLMRQRGYTTETAMDKLRELVG